MAGIRAGGNIEIEIIDHQGQKKVMTGELVELTQAYVKVSELDKTKNPMRGEEWCVPWHNLNYVKGL